MSKSPLHSSIARRLFKLLQPGLPAHFTLLREVPLILADSAPEPDLAIVRGDEKDFARQHPTTAALVIKIAVTSAAEDRSQASLYAEAGVEEYWIVLPVERRVEVYRRPENGLTSIACSWKGTPRWNAAVTPASASVSPSFSTDPAGSRSCPRWGYGDARHCG